MEHEDFYQNFRKKMQDWGNSKEGKVNKFADILMFGPDLFHLLVKLSFGENVSTSDKAKLASAIIYFVSPLDFLPEVLLGPVGYADDIAIAAYVLNNIVNNTDPEVVRKHWAGDEGVLKVIKQVIEIADKMVGAGLMKKIRGKFGG